MDARKIKQGLIWGCDSSPPLNKNLVPRFKTWGKKTEGVRANMIFTIEVALRKNVDSITIFVSMFCSENSNRRDNKRKGKTLEGSIFSNIEQLRINSWREALKHLSSCEAKHAPGGTEETIWRGFQSSEENCHDSITGHLGEGDL